MSTSLSQLAAQQHVDDLRREAQRSGRLREARQDDPLRDQNAVRIRRVAVIRSAGSHFALTPPRALLDARGR
jgi:hypothetical protein